MSEPIDSPRSTPFSIDESTDFGARATRHLREDAVVWLTTVSPSGVPTPNPVWFVWDGAGTVRLFTMPTTDRIKHLRTNSKVSLNFAGDGQGGDIVVLTGDAVADPQAPSATDVPDFIAKYAGRIAGMSSTPEKFAGNYSVPIVISLHRLRGH